MIICVNMCEFVFYTRRGFLGLQPLCGMGVTSFMEVTIKPLAFKALMADSRPVPTPLTKTLTSDKPNSLAFSTAILVIICAA